MNYSPISTRPRMEAPRGWKWRSLTEVARLESGHTPSRKVAAYWDSGDVPWLSLKDIRNLSSKYVFDTTDKPTALGIQHSSARILPRGTVALCRTASVGKAAVLGVDMATSQDFVNWVCGDEIWPEYLYWAFQSSQATFELEKQGSTHQTMYMPTVERFRILLPAVAEQRRIADIMDKAEALRAKRRAALAQLDTLTESMFLDMFGDPIRNDKAWPTMLISEVCELVRGSSPRPQGDPQFFGGPILRLMVADITRDGWLVTPAIDSLTIEGAKRSRRVTAGTVIMAVSGNVGLVSRLAVDACVHDGFVAFTKLDESKCEHGFLLAVLHFSKQLHEKNKAGAIFVNLTTTDIKAMRIPVPPLHLQRVYASRIDRVQKLRVTHRESLGELDALFASLQHRAFRGEL